MAAPFNRFAYRLMMVQGLAPAVSGAGWNQLSDESVKMSFDRNGGLKQIVSNFFAMPRRPRRTFAPEPDAPARDSLDLPKPPVARTNTVPVDR